MVCRSSCATCTSRVRSPPGSGVSEMRIVSPMPCCSRMPMEAAEATMPLVPMPASVRPRCKRVVGACRQIRIDGDQVLHLADLGGENDLVATHAERLGAFGRQERRLDDRLAHYRGGQGRAGKLGVFIHQVGQKLLVERAPVDADAHRLVVSHRDFDDVGELPVALVLETDIARIDPVFGQRLGAGRMIGQQLVADIVEIADERHMAADAVSRSRMRGTAAAASSRSTVTRTISEPAVASAATCATVASMSAVSVLVIDCTTTGAPPPTVTEPTLTAIQSWRSIRPGGHSAAAPARNPHGPWVQTNAV
jgi:hypothetical protein